MTVENLPIAPGVTNAELEERRVKAMELHAAETKRAVDIQAALSAPMTVDQKVQRFERMLHACLYARVATDVEGFLNFTRELCDGIDREFPEVDGG